MTPNSLYFGDNLTVLREHFPDECVDLIYLDPPFNSKRDYNYVYRSVATDDDTAQMRAFEDTWSFEGASQAFHEVTLTSEPIGKLLEGLRLAFGETPLLGYLSVMALRLRELHRVLKPTGSLYLHCDPTASHYLKLVLDAIFGERRFVNDIAWQRTHAHNFRARRFARVHDDILFYSKTARFPWTPQFKTYTDKQLRRYKEDKDGRRYVAQTMVVLGGSRNFPWRGAQPPAHQSWGYDEDALERLWEQGRIITKKDGTPRLDGLKVYLDEKPGTPLADAWTDIARIANTSPERLGFPTQKPLALLERIIAASSNEGDLVLDPFCGCGTAVVAAQKQCRRWCGIDITTLAVSLIKRRMLEHFPDVFPTADSIPVEGFPADVAGARVLAETDRYAFQFWTLTMLGASPAGGKARKGADKGIDGELSWRDASNKLCRGLVSVKSGHVNVNQIRDLVGTMQREKAELGVFVTLEEPSKPMRNEAASAGRYSIPGIPKDFPRVQTLTVEDLLAGKEPDMPRWRLNPFKEAQEIARNDQVTLDMDADAAE